MGKRGSDMRFGVLLSGAGGILSRLWTSLVLLAAAAAGMGATSSALRPLTQYWHDPEFASFAVYLIQVFVCIVIHELGHVAGAKIAGWRLQSIAVGPFVYLFDKRRMTVRKLDATRLISGLVAATPPVPNTLRSKAIFFSGGCVANFIFAALLAPFVGALRDNWNAWLALLGAWSIISLVIGFANLIPFGGFKGVRSDGLRLVDALMRRFLPERAVSRQAKRKPA